MPKRVKVTISDWSDILETYGRDAAAQVRENLQLLQSTFELMKALAEGKYVDAGVSAVSGTKAVVSTSKASPAVRTGVKVTSFMASTMQLSAGFRVLIAAGEGSRLATPGGILAFAGATLVVKTGLALGMAGDDAARAKCVGAIMEVAGNVVITALTWETGVGALLGLAAIGASAYSAYQECRK